MSTSYKIVGVVLLVAVLGSVLMHGAAIAAPTAQTCNPLSGCVLRENGSNARWWADSWHKGRCNSQTDQDWIVTYRTDNDTWRRADISKMRFYAAWWSKVAVYSWAGKAQVEDATTPGITLCIGSGRGLITGNDIKGTWVWLKP